MGLLKWIMKAMVRYGLYLIAGAILLTYAANQLNNMLAENEKNNELQIQQSQTSQPPPPLVQEIPENRIERSRNLDEFQLKLDKIEKESGACTDKYYLYGDISYTGEDTYNWITYKIIYLNDTTPVFEELKKKTIQSKIKHGDIIYLKEQLKQPLNWSYSIEIPPGNCDPIKEMLVREDVIRIELQEAGFDNTLYSK